MAGITAAAVKSLRDKTQLPMMECKRALEESGGDEDAAIEALRKKGAKTMAKRADRETAFGRMGIFASSTAGAMVELQCESAPVTKHEDFIALADGLAEQFANGPGAATADELLDQPFPGKEGTLRDAKDDLFNRIREVFNIGRMKRYESGCGAYCHNSGTVSGVLLAVEGGNDEAAKNISMHIAAMRPDALTTDDLDPIQVDKERGILREAALKEGKPEKIVDKMVEGRLRNYFADRVLMEQAYVKDDKLTVGKYAESQSMKLSGFVLWELGDA